MPMKPLRPCNYPGCTALTRTRYCETHAVRSTVQRPSAYQRGYTYKWSKQAKEFLRAHPWCAECAKIGQLVPATQVDHIIPHKGNQSIFWDKSNWQGLCDSHHSQKTAREDGGFGRKAKSIPHPTNDDCKGQDRSGTSAQKNSHISLAIGV